MKKNIKIAKLIKLSLTERVMLKNAEMNTQQ